MLIHVRTQKGKGYPPAESSADKYHGVVKFDTATGAQFKKKGNAPSYTSVFAKALIKEAEHDERIVAITAAMPSGTGVDAFAKHFPERAFDVGIAEQHGVTFAAGLATQGFRPFCAIYSTFLQRAYDQVVHDVAIQGLPVRFAMDRAGPGRRRRADPCRRVRRRLPRLPAGLRDHGRGRRGRADAHGRDHGADRRPAVGGALPARRGHRHRPARARHAARDRQGPDRARGRRADRAALVRRAPPGVPEGGRRADRARPLDDGRRRALRQAARPRADPPPRRRARGADHDRGGRDRRLRLARPAVHARGRACSTTAGCGCAR